ncbi:MAG TPA: alpha/beta hydrolase [Candidatus Binataceae bacterium]|nr:alpha/beta hydrolase [Candidatus Binataceae bacterium]
MNKPTSHYFEGTPRLHYLEWNPHAHRTIVLVHGNSANAWWWQWVVAEMAEFHIIALDSRGHGDSAWVTPPAYTPAYYVEDIARFIHGVLGRRKKPVLVGHSMGGLATLAFAARYPELAAGAVVIDAALTSSRGRDRYLSRLKALPVVTYPDLETAVKRFRLIPDEGEIPRERLDAIAHRSLMRTEHGRYTLKFDRESFFGGDGLPAMEVAKEIRIPTLLVRAEKSRILTHEAVSAAVEANQHLGAIEIYGAHHHVLLEKPVETADVIVQFARRHL